MKKTIYEKYKLSITAMGGDAAGAKARAELEAEYGPMKTMEDIYTVSQDLFREMTPEAKSADLADVEQKLDVIAAKEADKSTYLLRDIPGDLLRAVKSKSATEGATIRAVLLAAMEEYIKTNPK